MLKKFFHHMFEPHCPNCEHDRECKNCESLRDLLAEERATNRRLLDRIIELTMQKPIEERTEAPKVDFKPLRNNTSWKVKKELLEQEDRALARTLNEQRLQAKQSTDDLEKELLGVEHAREVS